MTVSAQKHPPRPSAPPHPSKAEMISIKSRELDKKYNADKKMILKNPILSKKMKRDQLKALHERYQAEKRLLKKL